MRHRVRVRVRVDVIEAHVRALKRRLRLVKLRVSRSRARLVAEMEVQERRIADVERAITRAAEPDVESSGGPDVRELLWWL